MILRRGLELLQTRPIIDKVDIISLELRYGFTIPIAYRLFIETFYPSLSNSIDSLETGKQISAIKLDIESKKDKYYFDQLFPLAFSMSTYLEYDFWSDKGYMQIGGGPSDGGILLCVTGEKSDSIIYNDGHSYEILAPNIFEFFRRVTIELTDTSINLVNYNKRWNENIWKLKD